MSHFGIVCPPVTGHIDPLAALGRSLVGRRHQVTVFAVADLEPKVRSEGLEFCPLGAADFPAGTLGASVARLKTLKGTASLRYAVECASRLARLILAHGPNAMRTASVDALLVDQNEPAGGSVAEYLELPFASICTSLPLNREPQIPPPFVSWPYSNAKLAVLRNRVGYAIADRFIAPIQKTLNEYRQLWKLPPLQTPNDSFSKIAEIAQMSREFDFPRARLPSTFHYVGPFFDDFSSNVPFPFERLDGRPLIYASLGTLQSKDHEYFNIMAEACANLQVQLVLSLGQAQEGYSPRLKGNAIVVNYAPQVKLLSQAALTITHSGMNTTQQSLSFGVPLVAIPLTHDQPAIAARLARTGAAIVIPPRKLTVERLREAVRRVLFEHSSYQYQARQMRQAIHNAGGLDRAAELVEQLVPVRV